MSVVNSDATKAATKEGQDWQTKYLHPPGGPSIKGIPDNSTASTVPISWTIENNVVAPTGTGTGTWSCLIFSFANPGIPSLAVAWAGAPPSTPGDYVITQLQNTQFNFGNDAEQWNGAVSRFRPMYRSVTTYLDVSDLYNQGMVYAAQVALNATVVSEGAGIAVAYQLNIGTLPVTPGQIVQSSPRSTTRHAKEGTFSPLYFLDPSVQYLAAQSVALTAGATLPGGAGITFDFSNSDDTPLVTPTFLGMSVVTTLYTGLLQQSTIIVKDVAGFQCLVPPASIWVPFVTDGPSPDPAAVNGAILIRHHVEDSMPSAMNDFGSFIRNVGSKLGKIWNVVKLPAQAALSLLPGGRLINGAINGVTAAHEANQLEQQVQPQARQRPKPVAVVAPQQHLQPVPAPRRRNQQQVEEPVPAPRRRRHR